MFALEATNSYFQQLMYDDADYFNYFIREAFLFDVKPLSLREVKHELARMFNWPVVIRRHQANQTVDVFDIRANSQSSINCTNAPTSKS
jgi:hypothetical protein